MTLKLKNGLSYPLKLNLTPFQGHQGQSDKILKNFLDSPIFCAKHIIDIKISFLHAWAGDLLTTPRTLCNDKHDINLD